MTLGQCFDEIRKIFFKGDVEVMAKMGIDVMREIKSDYFYDRPYPQKGWFLYFEGDDFYIVNEWIKIPVDISFYQELPLEFTPFEEIKKLTVPRRKPGLAPEMKLV